MKVAIVHDWIVKFGGGEWSVLNWHKIFPEAPIYTLVYDKKKMGEVFDAFDIRTTYLQKIPFSTKLYQMMLPLMPGAWERLDLTEYDLILSSCSSCCKGIITRPDAIHICYCHTPTRYLWDMFYEYRNESSKVKRILMTPMVNKLRIWDRVAADRVDYFIANSRFTKQRIKKYYRREAEIIYSMGDNMVPEDVFNACSEKENFYLMVGRLVGYKRADLAIKACNKLKKKLIIIGVGNKEAELRKIAGDTIEFKGFLPNKEIYKYYAKAKAFIFPGLEDFGLTPIEAQSGGTPVIAYGKGGALDTVIDGKTGKFFYEQSEEALIETITEFEKQGVEYSAEQIRNNALLFSPEAFRDNIYRFCMDKMSMDN